jgi:hypothetical protein
MADLAERVGEELDRWADGRPRGRRMDRLARDLNAAAEEAEGAHADAHGRSGGRAGARRLRRSPTKLPDFGRFDFGRGQRMLAPPFLNALQ